MNAGSGDQLPELEPGSSPESAPDLGELLSRRPPTELRRASED